MVRKNYPDDLKNQEWNLIKNIVTNAILYLLRSGCSWRLLPHNFPPWQTVYAQFRCWKRNGIFLRIYDSLRKKLRKKLGRHAKASAGIMDSQRIKTTGKEGVQAMMEARKYMEERGIF